MASPSEIPSHPQVEAVDSDGDSFPSKSSFHLVNVGAESTQALAFDPQTREIITSAPSDENQWLVEHHDTRGRWQIAIKLRSNGKYLAATSPKSGTPFWLSDTPQFWYVYTGAKPDSFWLSTLQSTDGFLFRHEQAGVKLMTGEDAATPELRAGSWREWNDQLSWRLEGSREYLQAKYAQKRAEAQQAKEDLDKRTQELEERERAAKQHRDATDAHVKKANAESELLAQTGKEERDAANKKSRDELAAREAKVKAAEQAAKKKHDELATREAKVATAEDRIRQSKKAGPADLLKSEQEKERLTDELAAQVAQNRSLAAERQSAQDALAQARAQLDRAPPASAAGLATTASSAPPLVASDTILGRPKAAPIPAPQLARPKQRRPDATRPPTTRPSATVPPVARPADVVPASTRPADEVPPSKKPRAAVPVQARPVTVVPAQTRPPTEVSTKTRPDEVRPGEKVAAGEEQSPEEEKKSTDEAEKAGVGGPEAGEKAQAEEPAQKGQEAARPEASREVAAAAA
nr:hypothetical protein CFP56_00200 [Quercus suber]